MEELVTLISLHPSSYFLHHMYITFYRFVTEKDITESDPLDKALPSVIEVGISYSTQHAIEICDSRSFFGNYVE